MGFEVIRAFWNVIVAAAIRLPGFPSGFKSYNTSLLRGIGIYDGRYDVHGFTGVICVDRTGLVRYLHNILYVLCQFTY